MQLIRRGLTRRGDGGDAVYSATSVYDSTIQLVCVYYYQPACLILVLDTAVHTIPPPAAAVQYSACLSKKQSRPAFQYTAMPLHHTLSMSLHMLFLIVQACGIVYMSRLPFALLLIDTTVNIAATLALELTRVYLHHSAIPILAKHPTLPRRSCLAG
jgi:hypothetical protein